MQEKKGVRGPPGPFPKSAYEAGRQTVTAEKYNIIDNPLKGCFYVKRFILSEWLLFFYKIKVERTAGATLNL